MAHPALNNCHTKYHGAQTDINILKTFACTFAVNIELRACHRLHTQAALLALDRLFWRLFGALSAVALAKSRACYAC
jgi:hypothetical protein